MSDLIRRQDVMKTLHELYVNRPLDSDRWIISDIREKVQDMTSAQQWIPCSERLPEIGQKVLVSTTRSVFTQVFKGYHHDPHVWDWERNTIKRIQAWQVLPEPYKEEQP